VIDAYLDGSLSAFFKQYDEQEKKSVPEGLRPEEARVLAFLEHISPE
jgi:hypothetical protein